MQQTTTIQTGIIRTELSVEDEQISYKCEYTRIGSNYDEKSDVHSIITKTLRKHNISYSPCYSTDNMTGKATFETFQKISDVAISDIKTEFLKWKSNLTSWTKFEDSMLEIKYLEEIEYKAPFSRAVYGTITGSLEGWKLLPKYVMNRGA